MRRLAGLVLVALLSSAVLLAQNEGTLDEESLKYVEEILGKAPVNVSSPRPDDRSNSVKPSGLSEPILDKASLQYLQNILGKVPDNVSSPRPDDRSNSVKPSGLSGQKKCITEENEYGICVHKSKCNFQNNVNTAVYCAQGQVCCSKSYVDETNQEAAPHSEKCGRSNSEHSFNNGSAQYGEFPWMVALIRNSRNANRWPYKDYIGSGTIIHPNVVITTAFKVYGLNTQMVKCRAGEWNIHSEVKISPPQVRELRKIIIHEEYSNVHRMNNIAMLVVKKPFQFGDNVGYACLDYQLPPPGKMTQCFSMGWGQERTSKFSALLKKVEVRYIEFEKCQEMLRGMDIIGGFELHRSQLCATGVGEEDLYVGDGGSPLACRNEDTSRYTVYGMVFLGFSSIDGTPPTKPPMVYVNVPNLHLWIDKEMEKEGFLDEFSRKNEVKK